MKGLISFIYRRVFTQWNQYPLFLVTRPTTTYNYFEKRQGPFWRSVVFKPNHSTRSITIYDVLEEQEQSRQFQSVTNDFDKVGLICVMVKLLRCSYKESEHLVEQNPKLLKAIDKLDILEKRISVLTDIGINAASIQFNFWLLGFDKGKLVGYTQRFSSGCVMQCHFPSI